MTDTPSDLNRSAARTAILTGVLSAALLVQLAGTQPATAATAARVPPPDLARFLPATYRVTALEHVSLDGSPIPEIALAAVGTVAEGSSGYAPSTVLVLAWDPIVQRWTVAFDAAKTSSYLTSTQTGLGPGLVFEEGPHLDLIHGQRGLGADLLYWLDSVHGNSGQLLMGILHYAHAIARLVYTFRGDEGHVTLFDQPGPTTSSDVAVVGAAPHQEVRVTLPWLTAVDSRSQAARMYSFIVAPTGAFDVYQVVSTTKSYAGVGLRAVRGSTAGQVACVDPHAPAARVLRVGDVVTGLIGSALPARDAGGLLGPIAVEQVALRYPGARVAVQVVRRGRIRTVEMTLARWRAPSPCASTSVAGVSLFVM